MLNKKIEELKESDLQSLIDNKVLESKTIDYKKELPNNTDSAKKEFLADITSFANSSGGDLIYGISQDNKTGHPISPDGIKTDNIDNEKTRLDNIIRDGVEPRILNVAIQPIRLSNSNYVIVIRIPKSWIAPHRVILGSHARFYARNSSGKYEMDVDELRIAFNLSETLTERIRNFRVNRIAKIGADETPVPLLQYPKIVLHLIPINAFNPAQKYNIDNIFDNRHDKLPLIYRSVLNGRFNLDGLVTYSDSSKQGIFSAYTQLYKNGIIEACDALMLKPREEHGAELKIIHTPTFEKKMIEAISSYFKLLSELTVEPPLFIFLNLLGMRDYRIAGKNLCFDDGYPIDRDLLLLPETIIEDYSIDSKVVLKPLFDLIWNACGYQGSLNFDEHGNWIN